MIRTSRLVLREWRETDLDAFAAMSADPRVMEFFPSLLDRAQSASMIARWKAHFAEHGFGFLAIEVPGVADFVGICGMAWARFDAHFTPCVEIGWRLAYDHWGHGYASEAAQGVLDYGFTTLHLDQIVAFAVVSNRRSRQVMERIGMTYDPADDFDHPVIPVGSPLRRHVLYRATRDGAPPKR
jgi:RimJ/RimL family protein N-acetyltransferase